MTQFFIPSNFTEYNKNANIFVTDSDYVKFLDSLDHPDSDDVVPIETYLEELEAKEREVKGNEIKNRAKGNSGNCIFLLR